MDYRDGSKFMLTLVHTIYDKSTETVANYWQKWLI